MMQLRRLAKRSQSYGKQASTLVIAATPDELALIVNGAERRIPAGWTLADLLASLALDARTVVIERNGIILRDRASFAKLELASDDSIEIVHFVGEGGASGARRSDFSDYSERPAAFHHRGPRVSLTANGGHGQVRVQRADDRGDRRLGCGSRDRRCAAGGSRPVQGRGDPAPSRSGSVLPAGKHCRVLQCHRRDSLRSSGARGRIQRMGEARGHRRPADPAAGYRWSSRSN